MTAAELLTRIEHAGGTLNLLPDGQLMGKRVPRELHDTLRAMKPDVITLLQLRDKPAGSGGFVYRARPIETWERRTKLDADGEAGFQYQARTLKQWLLRTTKTAQRETGLNLGDSTPCVDCGCRRSDHHLHPEGHRLNGEFLYYCVTAHCTFCDCLHFRGSLQDLENDPKFTRPGVDDWTLCGRCSHARRVHCTPSKKLVDPCSYQGLTVEGKPIRCVHTLTGAYVCTSGHCAEVVINDGEGDFCPCPRFKNPWLKPRKKETKPRVPRKRKGKEKAPFITGQGSLLMAESEVNP